ncbi:MAG: ribosome maturation factor RimP [Coriobacteriia bacterium]|nr:ribosome maturation factor RimP [Coriobacteriia bacterium]
MRGVKEQRLIDVLEPEALAQGFELVDVEFCGAAGNRILRVLLDKEGGIGIEDIAAANAWVDALIEENAPFNSAFTLEVSSPGIDRPLRTPEHFARFTGEEARITTEHIEGRANWAGTLAGVASSEESGGDELAVLIVIEGETHSLPFAKIKKAHLKAHIDFNRTQGL